MTDEQVLMMVNAFGHMSAIDSFLGAFLGIALWRLIDWISDRFTWG